MLHLCYLWFAIITTQYSRTLIKWRAKGLAKFVLCNKVSLYRVFFLHIHLYFTITGIKKKLFVITRTLDSQGLLFWGSTVLMKQGIWWKFSEEWNGIMFLWVMTVPLIWWAAKENNVERISIGLYAIRKQLFLQSLYSGSNIVVCEPVLVITAFIERKALEKKIQIHYQHFKNCLEKETGFGKEEKWSRTKILIFKIS